MPVQTSLFLPTNLFPSDNSYAASLVGSNGNTSTLVIGCTAGVSHAASSCSPTPPVTITVAPTTFAMTTVSTGEHTVVTITETCTVAPAMSTAVCNVTADTGLFAPFNVSAGQYTANILSVNVTNVQAKTTATLSSSGTMTKAKTIFAFAFCAISVAIAF